MEEEIQCSLKYSGSVVVLHDALVITMDSQSRVFRNGAVAVRGDTIVAVGQSQDVISQFSSTSPQLINLQGHILLPGLINTHVHTSQQLARGIADDVDLLTWLHDRIWPYESNMTEEDSYLSTLLCGIELIHSGVTCFAEAGGQHVPGMARAIRQLGIRACLTQSVMDAGEGLPASWAKMTVDECIQHVAEIPYENQLVVERYGIDHGTITYLEKIKLLQDNLLAAHTVWVNENEVRLISQSGVKVSHCPAAAMRMLGFAPIREMIDAGVCVSLGTDGAPSNNRMSIVDEMYLASLVNKGREVFGKGTTDPTVLPAETILEMATMNGAKSVLWEKEIGSLQVGKKADMIVVDPSSWSMMPVHDCISNLVYCMRTENITSVMCNGCWIMKEVIAMAQKASNELLKRAGIQIPSRMNFL
ncbi:5-methylthioadenosine/S-adenosylhomocysteinedeaminase [Striga asiatica]|uniref:5-methylthioadenosine/S-adenosylhomocysteinedeaminase n=1 Tax=Striga asiatica TaxID=4170 RepID=A0A5A7PWJ7_STRAF|nr:5-methylthioadenosine/S-adenosylhomocysteinedeaminase [Striga asiatica]